MKHYKTETLLYGVKIGQPDYMEDLITVATGSNFERDVRLNNAQRWAIENGFHKFRKVVHNLNEKPDFIKAINI